MRSFPVDAVRDNAGRRFPAHLDALPPDEVPLRWAQFPRYDRAPAKGWYHLRPGPGPGPGSSHEPGRVGPSRPDHPTDAEVELARQKRLYGRSPWWPTREAALRTSLGLDPAPEDD